MSDYTIRITTPADFSGFAGIVSESAKAVGALNKVNEAASRTARALEMKPKTSPVGGVAESIAKDKTAVEVYGSSFIDMLGKIDAQIAADKAPKASLFSGLTSQLLKIAAPIGAAVGGMAILKAGFKEIAEDDGAAATLKKYALSAEEAAQATEMLSQVKGFTGGDKVQAAELIGRVLNGNTRGLEQYGIKLEENATREERMNAVREIAARGAEQLSEKNKTLGGSLSSLGTTFGNASGNLVGALHLTEAFNFANFAINDLGKSMNSYTAEAVDAAKKQTALHMEQKKVNRASSEQADALGLVRKQLKFLADDSEKAAAKYALLNAQINAGAVKGRAVADVALAKINAGEDAAVERGDMTPEDAARRKAENSALAAVESAKAEVDTAQQKYDLLVQMERDNTANMLMAQQAGELLKDEDEKKKNADTVANYKKTLDQLKVEKITADADIAAAVGKRDVAQAGLEGTQSANKAAVAKQAAESERELNKISDEEFNKFLDDTEKQGEASKNLKKKLNSAQESTGAKFSEEFGTGKKAKDVLKRAQDAARKKLDALPPEDRAEAADKVFSNEIEGAVKTDKATGKRSLKTTYTKSAADQQGSSLDRFPKAKVQTPNAPDSQSTSILQGMSQSLQQTASMISQINSTLVPAVKKLQTDVSKMKNSTDNLDQSVTK